MTDEAALRIVFVGHVDHGKSTLVGRILYETESVLPSKIKMVEEICKDRGMKFEYAFLLDALEEEQDQGVTIDVSQVNFRTKRRPYCVIDAPGHKEFLKHMISGASSADVAILLIDAEEGLREQSKRHATILSLLGVKTILVVINKMDLVDYKKEVFEKIKSDTTQYLLTLKITTKAFMPMAAYEGENLKTKSSKMPWYDGLPFLELLDNLNGGAPACRQAGGSPRPGGETHRPLRFPLQDVYKFDQQRIFAGRVESGKISAGDEILFLPSEKMGTVKSIEKWKLPAGRQVLQAVAGESIGIVLEDQIFVERGEVACHAKGRPTVSRSFLANIFWMGTKHLEQGARCLLKLTTQEVECVVDSVLKIVDSSTLEEVAGNVKQVAKNEVAEIILTAKKPVVFDSFDAINETGRFVLVHDKQVRGGGIILKKYEHFGSI